MTTSTDLVPTKPTGPSARDIHAEALQRHADAAATAEALRARARAGDDTVTGVELHAADAEVELASLRLPAAEAAAKAEAEAEQEAARITAAERYAADEADARAAFLGTLAGVRQALATMAEASRAYDLVIMQGQEAAERLGTPGRFDVLHAGQGPYDEVHIQGKALRRSTLHPWVQALFAEATGRTPNTIDLHPKEQA